MSIPLKWPLSLQHFASPIYPKADSISSVTIQYIYFSNQKSFGAHNFFGLKICLDPKWPTGSGKGSNPKLLGALINFFWNNFIDPSTPSMRKGCNKDKKNFKKRWKKRWPSARPIACAKIQLPIYCSLSVTPFLLIWIASIR